MLFFSIRPMDSGFVLALLAWIPLVVCLPSGRMGVAMLETTPSVFHVFRNVKASEVNNQQRSSNSHLSETTRIIQEMPGLPPSSSSSSFTIISRLFKSADVPSIPEWKSTAGISARRSQDGINLKEYRSSDRYTIENGWIRYKSDDLPLNDVGDFPESGDLVLDPELEDSGQLETSSAVAKPVTNSVVLDGINIGHFLFKNASQLSKLFESGQPKPLVLVQNVYDRPNAQAESSIRLGEVILNGMNPFEIAEEASEFPATSGAGDKYDYYSLVLRIDKSQVSPEGGSSFERVLLRNGSFILPHHQTHSAKSLDDGEETDNVLRYEPDTSNPEPPFADEASDLYSFVQNVTLAADELIPFSTSGDEEAAGIATDSTTYVPDELLSEDERIVKESATKSFTCGQHSSGGLDERQIVFTNPSFPAADTRPGRCSFRMRIASQHVCQVRVDFNQTQMLPPRRGFCIDQYLTVSGSAVVPAVNKFCGNNADQHFYLELAEAGANARTLDFNVVTQIEGIAYNYSLIIQQIDCREQPLLLPSPPPSSQLKAPGGCFQYFNQDSGLIRSFNFDGGHYINNQNYRICVQAVNQSCALSLSAADGHFGLHQSHPRQVFIRKSGVGSRSCIRDYLWIPVERNGSLTQDRHCGAYLSPIGGDTQSRPIISTVHDASLFRMELRTGVPDRFDDTERGPGFRIEFQHQLAQGDRCSSQKKISAQSSGGGGGRARARWNRMQIFESN